MTSVAYAEEASPARQRVAASLPARVGFEVALLLAGALACLFFSGYLFVDVSVPAGVEGDHLFLVTMAKSYLDGHGFRLNPNLGFPDVQDFLYFPTFETTQRAILWLGAMVTRNPFSAVHAYYIAGIALMFGTSEWALRWLGVRWPLAAAASVGYVVSPYLATRAFGHDFLALSYAAPFGCALALKLVTAPAWPWRTAWRDPFVVVALIAAGASGVYYGFFSLMFVAFAAVAGAASQRRWGPLVAGVALAAAMFAVLLVSGFGLDLPAALFGGHPKATRQAAEELVYGLDLASIGGVLDVVASARARYAEAQAAVPQAFTNEGGGEFPGLVLTLILVLSPLIAAASPLTSRGAEVERGATIANRDRLNLIGASALFATFGLLYAARGGLGFLFGLLISPEIRATGRIIPFLAFLALVTVCMAAELTAEARRFALRWAPAAAAALALGLGMLPVYKTLQKSQMARYTAPAQREKREATPRMLVAKDRLGALRVLELPVMYWPEAPVSRADIDPYGAQLPYIYDRIGSPTRWSYGASQLQPGFTLRQFNLKRADGLPRIARAYGYDAILLQKKSFDTGEVERTEAALDAEVGPGCRAYDDAVYALYSLKPPCGGAR